jgi:hypothetical protein
MSTPVWSNEILITFEGIRDAKAFKARALQGTPRHAKPFELRFSYVGVIYDGHGSIQSLPKTLE